MTTRNKSFVTCVAVAALGLMTAGAGRLGTTAATEWAINATVIEACSCPLVCQCYFNNPRPAGHHDHGGKGGAEHFCRSNLAHRVNRGNYGAVRLEGVKFWEAADLGGDFAKGMDWMVLHFDPAVSPAQREAVLEIYNKHVKPLPYKSFRVGEDATIEWSATKDLAEARLGGGAMAEVVLRKLPGLTDEPVVIRNLKYFGAPRNDGFVLMPNEVETYRIGSKAFEFKGSNGFMITYDMTSRDVAAK